MGTNEVEDLCSDEASEDNATGPTIEETVVVKQVNYPITSAE